MNKVSTLTAPSILSDAAPDRRAVVIGSAATLAGAMLPAAARAQGHGPTLASFNLGTNVITKPYSWDLTPPTTTREAFLRWNADYRGEDPRMLDLRWERFVYCRSNHDFVNPRNERAFLLTPRDQFVMKRDADRSYERAFLDIGYGVTISGPLIVARMTSTIDVKVGEKVLEIGTGSGYQSAYLANLTDKVYTIEIIKPLAERTRALYDQMIARGYTEYRHITSKHADGYYGWEENAPFDKIIVTCGVDHVPPPLLQQLKPNGSMVIPIGPPGGHVILKVMKRQMPDGSIQVARSNVYHQTTPFVPFTKLEGDRIRGVHSDGR
jgi:protein-L-isoaspartate(D-aspartate) O-methyltransferase